MARKDDAAELRWRVTFQRFTGEADLVGDYQYLDDANWEEVLTVWAQIRTIGSREFTAAGLEENEITHNIKVRFRRWERDVTRMRAKCGDNVFRLVSPPLDLDGDRRYQLIKAAEVWR